MSFIDLRPQNLSLKELAHYGEQHPDFWVRRLARIVGGVHDGLTEEGMFEDDVAQYFEDVVQKIENLKYDVIHAEEEVSDRERDLADAEKEIRSLRYDLDKDHQAADIKRLKSEVWETKRTNDELCGQMRTLRSNFDALQESYRKLEAAHNTWKGISE